MVVSLKRKRYLKGWYQKNKERLRIYLKEWRQKPENKRKRLKYEKGYRQNNKTKIKKIQREYIHSEKGKIKRQGWLNKNKERVKNIKRKYEKTEKSKQRHEKYRKKKERIIIGRLRGLLKNVLNNYVKTEKVMSSKKYGVDYKAIIEHLKPFPNDLSNYQIHHIKPLYTFNFINKDGSTNLKEVQEAFKPENHKWVTIEEHKEIHKIGGIK